jgi:hypothetical protein
MTARARMPWATSFANFSSLTAARVFALIPFYVLSYAVLGSDMMTQWNFPLDLSAGSYTSHSIQPSPSRKQSLHKYLLHMPINIVVLHMRPRVCDKKCSGPLRQGPSITWHCLLCDRRPSPGRLNEADRFPRPAMEPSRPWVRPGLEADKDAAGGQP